MMSEGRAQTMSSVGEIRIVHDHNDPAHIAIRDTMHIVRVIGVRPTCVDRS